MKLEEIYSQREKSPTLSFEVFPPKEDLSGEKLEKLINNLIILKKYNPALISLTYGACGSTQEKSFEIIKKIQKLNLEVMPHFTCVGSSKDFVMNYLNDIERLEINNILALRGDLPGGSSMNSFDFKYANELVEFIKKRTDLSIGVAGYPEGHIDCENINKDLENLKKKVDAGAKVIYTQLFFNNDKLFNFIEQSKKANINIPIIPGILPITSYKQLHKMLTMCKVELPEELKYKLEKFKDAPEDIRKIGIEFATAQCQQLIKSDIEGLHFYTINSANATSEILDELSI